MKKVRKEQLENVSGGINLPNITPIKINELIKPKDLSLLSTLYASGCHKGMMEVDTKINLTK